MLLNKSQRNRVKQYLIEVKKVSQEEASKILSNSPKEKLISLLSEASNHVLSK